MSIWDFKIAHKILKWLMVIVFGISMVYGFLFNDHKKGFNFYFSSVNFLTKPLVDHLLEPLNMIGKSPESK